MHKKALYVIVRSGFTEYIVALKYVLLMVFIFSAMIAYVV